MKSKRMLICLLALFATSISSCGEGDTSSTNSNDDNTSYIDTTLNTTDDSTTGTSIDVGGDEDKDYSGVPATNVTIHYHADNGNYHILSVVFFQPLWKYYARRMYYGKNELRYSS